jgi:hypothetical protein
VIVAAGAEVGAGLASQLAPASLDGALAPGATIQPAKAGADPLDTMSREELHALAKERGLKVHHSSGTVAVVKAIRAAGV